MSYLPRIALALTALFLTDLAVGLAYRAVTGDSFYYSLIHSDRGRNRRYRTRSEIYHHDLAKSVAMPAVWGDEYFVHTNSLGFRDREVRDVALETDAPRILLIGDSFVEGVQVDFDDTLAGLLSLHFREDGIDVLNAGVSSYSPTIYARKVRYLIEDVGLRFSHLIVFLDVADIHDEAIAYDLDDDGNVIGPGESSRESVKDFARDYSVLYGLPRFLKQQMRPARPPIEARNVAIDIDRSRWTIDEGLFRAFGARGLEKAERSMNRLADLLDDNDIALTVVVYPWPAQIFHRDIDSKQVRFWRDWSREHGADFIDLFPGFVSVDPVENERVIRDLFIRHDFHWNEAGHHRAAELVIGALEENGFPAGPSEPDGLPSGRARVSVGTQ